MKTEKQIKDRIKYLDKVQCLDSSSEHLKSLCREGIATLNWVLRNTTTDVITPKRRANDENRMCNKSN